MPRKSPDFDLQERSGTQYLDLAAAQKAALKATAADLVSIIHAMLASGALVECNKQIIPNPRAR